MVACFCSLSFHGADSQVIEVLGVELPLRIWVITWRSDQSVPAFVCGAVWHHARVVLGVLSACACVVLNVNVCIGVSNH